MSEKVANMGKKIHKVVSPSPFTHISLPQRDGDVPCFFALPRFHRRCPGPPSPITHTSPFTPPLPLPLRPLPSLAPRRS